MVFNLFKKKQFSKEDAYDYAIEYLEEIEYNKKRDKRYIQKYLLEGMSKSEIKKAVNKAHDKYLGKYSVEEAYLIALPFLYQLGKVSKWAKDAKLKKYLHDEMDIYEIEMATKTAYKAYFEPSILGKTINGVGSVVGGTVGIASGIVGRVGRIVS